MTGRQDETGREHDDRCESEFITGPMAWSPCGCADRSTPDHAAGRVREQEET